MPEDNEKTYIKLGKGQCPENFDYSKNLAETFFLLLIFATLFL